MSQHYQRELILLLSLSLLVTGALATDAPTITVLPADNILDLGETSTVTVLLDAVPTGLSGFNITIALTNSSVGEFTQITFPSWAMMPRNSSLPADSVFVQAVDLERLVEVNATNVTLCTLTFRGDTAGTTNLTITPIKVDDDSGGRYAPTVVPASVTVWITPTPTPTVALSLIPGTATISPGNTTQYTIVMDSAPAGLSGFNISVALTDPSVGEFTQVTFPSWAMMPRNSSLPADSVFVQAVDLERLVEVNATNVTLCTLTFRGDTAGTTNLTITPIKVDDDVGGRYAPGTTDAILVVETLPAPVADFTADPTEGNAPLTVRFTDTSAGNPTTWNWDFGDGSTSTDQSPAYTYTAPGNYTVNLTVSSGAGSDTLSRPGYITVTTSMRNTLSFDPLLSEVRIGGTTSYNVVLDTVPAGLSGFNISVALTDPSVGEIVDISYPAWAMMPKNSSLPADSVFVQAVDLERLVEVNATNVTLCTLTFRGDAAGVTSLTITPIKVDDDIGSRYAPDTTDAILVVETLPAPVADFTADPTEGNAPLTVQFTDESAGNVTAWLWDFGDGNTSTEQNPAHTYATADTYTVSLNASNAYGFSIVTRVDCLTVLDLPVAAFAADPTEGNAPLTVRFTDRSTGNVTSWAWDFGDGNTSRLQNPAHTYGSAGRYNITLNASNAYGHSISSPVTITVLDPPAANFTANITSGPAPFTVRFTDRSTGNPTAWNWSFGDGNASTDQSPAYTYTAPGNYTVGLTVSSGAGSDTLSRPGYIIVTVRGDFNGNGEVDIGDVSRVACMVVGKEPADLAADFNGNGRVDIGDAAKIAYYFVGEIGEL